MTTYRDDIQNNLLMVLDLAQPTINELTDQYVEKMLNQKHPHICTEFEIECYRIGVVSDLVRAFSRYIKSTDNVDVKSFSTGKGGVITIDCVITRNEIKHNMLTEMIYAGGYNIQQLHYRYISHTDLPASENKDAIQLLQERRNRLTKLQKVNEDIEYTNNWYKRDVDNFNKLKSMSFDEVIENSYVSKTYSGEPNTYENLSDGGKENFHFSPKEYEVYLNNLKAEIWQSHLNKIKDSILKEKTKEYEKQMLRHNTKLKTLLEYF